MQLSCGLVVWRVEPGCRWWLRWFSYSIPFFPSFPALSVEKRERENKILKYKGKRQFHCKFHAMIKRKFKKDKHFLIIIINFTSELLFTFPFLATFLFRARLKVVCIGFSLHCLARRVINEWVNSHWRTVLKFVISPALQNWTVHIIEPNSHSKTV